MLGPLREGAPRRIGPYEVLARLGAGGMGEVFLARAAGDTVSDSFVAVKTVRRDVAGDPAFRDRFRREIKVASLVDSAYAAAPVGGDADAGTPWLATAYVPGPSLSQAVRRGGPLPVAAVRALGADVARALADLHGAGVLHRDLKPGNVMLSVDGPRLIDFGIARSNTATTMTATGMMVGTPSFMSPEHVAGARRVTAASDVFCLGSLLCYAATGEDPFGDGPLAAVLYRVSQAEADLSRVPGELRGTIAACLALDPADRPTPEALVGLLDTGAAKVFPWPEGVREHIGEYGGELARLVASGGPLLEAAPGPAGPAVAPAVPGLHSVPTLAPVSAPTVPAGPAAGAPRKRRRAVAAVLALAVVAGGLGTYLLWPDPEPPKAPAKAAPPAGPRVPGVDGRGTADASGVVAQNAAQRPVGWKPWRAKLTAPALGCSTGEKALVCRTTDGRYEALDPANGKRLWAADLVTDPRDDTSTIGPTGGIFVAGSTNVPAVHGDSVVLLSGRRLQVRDARSGAVRWEQKDPAQAKLNTQPIVGDDTVFVLSGEESDQVTAFALADGRRLWSASLTNAELARGAFRDFGPVAYANGLVYALSDGGLVALDAKTGQQRGQVPAEAKECDSLSVQGRYAYCATLTTTLALYRLDAATLAPAGGGRLPLAADVTKSGAWPAAVSARTAVAVDRGPLPWRDSGNTDRPAGVFVLAPTTGKTLAHYPIPPLTGADGKKQYVSGPLIAGDTLVYADFSALHLVPLGRNGAPGKERVVPVPGAPGPRAKDPYERGNGTDIGREIRPPEVLPLGGVVHVVYDTGVVASVTLPEE
ncbi:PQQ-binding-like beta-propeller repeat protein [Streptomyces sp. NRRL B-24572]|uniref:serine/threonine-protein kinase n=1 Tax=Streptomyces sp. NRRL B-24572 TaxID=1962156 RepID=UPI00211B0D0D|nr:serine/threonine-protein kinase [Streptomyces sp. NRRL B-24572]